MRRLLSLLWIAGCGVSAAPLDSGIRDSAVDAARMDAGDASLLDSANADSVALDVSLADAAVDSGGAPPDPACVFSGCLQEATLVGDYTLDDLIPFLEPGVDVDNGYSVWLIRFHTAGRTAIATVTIPYRVGAPLGGFHIVGNNHGTSGVGDPCALTGTIFGTGLAGLYGARGMIGVAPDYPGLGTEGLHPYLVADVEGHAALDALRAAEALARWRDVPTSRRFATTGLSQGGHATLAAAERHSEYAPEMDIRAFGAAAPASGWEEQWRSGVSFDGPHILYHALLVYAWADHYGYEGPALWTPEFGATVEGTFGERCLFDVSGTGTFGTLVGESRAAVFDAGFLSAYESGEWGEYAAFSGYFARNRIRAYVQTAPLRIYQGDADTTVIEPATRALVEALRAGAVDTEYIVVPGGTHLNVAFGFVASDELRTDDSIAWLRGLLDAP